MKVSEYDEFDQLLQKQDGPIQDGGPPEASN